MPIAHPVESCHPYAVKRSDSRLLDYINAYNYCPTANRPTNNNSNTSTQPPNQQHQQPTSPPMATPHLENNEPF
jgi:hypothetical protein